MKFAICILTPLPRSVETKGRITHCTRAASDLIRCGVSVRAFTREHRTPQSTLYVWPTYWWWWPQLGHFV